MNKRRGDFEWLRAQIEAGRSVLDIADGLGLTTSAIYARLSRGGIPVRLSQPGLTGKFEEALDDVYTFIVEFKRSHGGVAPSYIEIMAGCDLVVTKSAVGRLLKELGKRGLVLLSPGCTRHIIVVGGEWRLWQDGQPCSHPGCLSHVLHRCEVCGRVAGWRDITPPRLRLYD